MPESGNRVRGAALSARLLELGIKLPDPPKPLGVYVPAVEVDGLLFLSGMLPLVQGEPRFRGRLGDSLAIAEGREAAKMAALNALSVAGAYLRDLDRLSGLVRVGVSIATTEGFTEHAAVADGASELFAQIFGPTPGHARLASGVQSLSLGVPVALDVVFRLRKAS